MTLTGLSPSVFDFFRLIVTSAPQTLWTEAIISAAAAVHKTAKYEALDRTYIFQLFAVESLGPFDDEGCCFLADLGRKIWTVSGDDRDNSFLFQRISVSIQ